MRIRSINVRRFRSIERSGLAQCGGLNVLIGKNNAGKSNVLSTIDLMHRHLQRGAIAGPWQVQRPADEFTDRQTTRPIQIGIVFDLTEEVSLELRERLKAEAPHLERSIEQIKPEDTIAFIMSACLKGSTPFLFVEKIAVGTVNAEDHDLQADGMNLLSVSQAVAHELFANQQETVGLRNDIRALEGIIADPNRLNFIFENRERSSGYFFEGLFGPEIRASQALVRQITTTMAGVPNVEEFRNRLTGLAAEMRDKAEKLEHRETEGTIGAFAGATKKPPSYATWLMQQYGSVPMLHVRETRDPIGREEAEALLNLKVTRGGPARLVGVQATVRSLLGVEVDAFQAEQRRPGARAAEMDIDKFLVEANGAGVREALRLVLDLELKRPRLLLLEEPEAHLHPGLEHAVYSFLRDKSEETQMFVTTGWYDIMPMIPISQVIGQLMGTGQMEYVRQSATWHAERDLKGVYKLLGKLPSPVAVCRRFASMSTQMWNFVNIEIVREDFHVARKVRHGYRRGRSGRLLRTADAGEGIEIKLAAIEARHARQAAAERVEADRLRL